MGTVDAATTDNADAHELLWALIKGIRFAVFTTRHASGHIDSRPMTTQNCKLDKDASLWFFRPRDSQAVTDMAAEPLPPFPPVPRDA